MIFYTISPMSLQKQIGYSLNERNFSDDWTSIIEAQSKHSKLEFLISQFLDQSLSKFDQTACWIY